MSTKRSMASVSSAHTDSFISAREKMPDTADEMEALEQKLLLKSQKQSKYKFKKLSKMTDMVK